jgi:hypothetical protein
VSKCWKQEKSNWKRDGFVQLKSVQSGCTGLSGGAPDSVRWCTEQCPVRQAGSGELAAFGTLTVVYDINHRTVRWCTGLSGESFTGEVVGLGKPSTAYDYNSPDCPVRHRTAGATVGRGFRA